MELKGVALVALGAALSSSNWTIMELKEKLIEGLGELEQVLIEP